MSDSIVGVMWCRNEADLLPHTIPAALKVVDALMVCDDDSDDASWKIIKSFESQLEYCVRRKEVLYDTPYRNTPSVFGRAHLLDEVRRRFGYKNTWVQIIESDAMVLDTDIRKVIREQSRDDVAVRWHMLNAIRTSWPANLDTPRIPTDMPLDQYFDACHWMEEMSVYTYRPLPGIQYGSRPVPWPHGFSQYYSDNSYEKLRKLPESPLVLHYGFRSPTFYYNKMKPILNGARAHPRYLDWDLSSPEAVKRTVPFYNNTYDSFSPMTREGWKTWLTTREDN